MKNDAINHQTTSFLIKINANLKTQHHFLIKDVNAYDVSVDHRIVFNYSNVYTNRPGIYLFSKKEGIKQLTNGVDTKPVFSKDGNAIAFIRGYKSDNPDHKQRRKAMVYVLTK